MQESNLKVIRNTKNNHYYGSIIHNEREYSLIFGHPYEMLRDKNISWETKGYLSYLVNLSDDIQFSLPVINELINFGYLIEVTNG